VLLALKRRMGFLEQGHDMLERKKELLTRLVYERLAQYRSLRREIGPAIEAALRSLGITHMRMGACLITHAGGIPAHDNLRSQWDAGCRFEYPNPDYR
jgi:V/A-type H+-transporting ATPase subunit D